MSCSTTDADVTEPSSLLDTLGVRMPDARSNGAMYLNEAASEFFRRSERWRDKTKTITFVPGQTTYAPPTYLGRVMRIVDLFVDNPNSTDEKVAIGEVRGFTTEHDAPISWHSPDTTTIILDTPVTTELTVYVYAVLRPTKPDYRCDPTLLDFYREPILNGAMHYATMSQDQESENLRTTSSYKYEFEAGIKDAECYWQHSRSTERRRASSRMVQRGRHRGRYAPR